MAKRTILVLTTAQRSILIGALKGFAEEGAVDEVRKVRAYNNIQRQMDGKLTRAEMLNVAEQIHHALASISTPSGEVG